MKNLKTILPKLTFLLFLAPNANASCELDQASLYNYSGRKRNDLAKTFLSLTTTKGTYECDYSNHNQDNFKANCTNGASFLLPKRSNGWDDFDIAIGGQIIPTTKYEVTCPYGKPRGINFSYIPGTRTNQCSNTIITTKCTAKGEERVIKWFTRNPINGTKVEITSKMVTPIEKLKD